MKFAELMATKNSSALFTNMEIPMERIDALCELVTECKKHNVEISKVTVYQCGFQVTFNGKTDADAICHENSYGSSFGEWETIGFPWDCGDVSVHRAEELAELLDDYFTEMKQSKYDPQDV